MKKSELAEQLRERQCEQELKEIKKNLNDIKDEAIIDAYVTCSCCGEKMIDESELEKAISNSSNVDEFLIILDELEGQKSDNHHLN